ncbi:hypothetical protein OSB04_011320 [Centaurea solstitialis]|uniref:Berberine/berberine-like domain-containing protein n=1 Tax=Centaurea solstitialis TaxID=347529 RepID=A0AA38TJY1_9ASTR|nr:hypothetical protein OSB04_011320 [Centaurea solstitialis]
MRVHLILKEKFDVHDMTTDRRSAKCTMPNKPKKKTPMLESIHNSPRTAYLNMNYNDLDLGVGRSYLEARSSWGPKYFSNNFNRLVKVKTMVDPGNFYKHGKSIPTRF